MQISNILFYFSFIILLASCAKQEAYSPQFQETEQEQVITRSADQLLPWTPEKVQLEKEDEQEQSFPDIDSSSQKSNDTISLNEQIGFEGQNSNSNATILDNNRSVIPEQDVVNKTDIKENIVSKDLANKKSQEKGAVQNSDSENLLSAAELEIQDLANQNEIKAQVLDSNNYLIENEQPQDWILDAKYQHLKELNLNKLKKIKLDFNSASKMSARVYLSRYNSKGKSVYSSGQFISQCHILTVKHLLTDISQPKDQSFKEKELVTKLNIEKILNSDFLNTKVNFLTTKEVLTAASEGKALSQTQTGQAVVVGQSGFGKENENKDQLDWIILKVDNYKSNNFMPITKFSNADLLQFNKNINTAKLFRMNIVDWPKLDMARILPKYLPLNFGYFSFYELDIGLINVLSESGLSGAGLEVFNSNTNQWEILGILKSNTSLILDTDSSNIIEKGKLVMLNELSSELQDIMDRNPCN